MADGITQKTAGACASGTDQRIIPRLLGVCEAHGNQYGIGGIGLNALSKKVTMNSTQTARGWFAYETIQS